MRFTLLFLFCWLVTGGCSSHDPSTEHVEGVVLLDGKPIEGATVFFSPVQSGEGTEAGLAAAGRTDSDGTFHLNAINGGKSGAGTKVGEYIVSVMKQRGDPLPARAADALPGSPPLNLKIQDLLPVTYKSAATSPLRATVKQGRNTFRFDLDSSARGGEKR